jgi:hypothetical protein
MTPIPIVILTALVIPVLVQLLVYPYRTADSWRRLFRDLDDRPTP